MSALAFGADQVIITDITPNNLELAAQHYNATTLLTTPHMSPEEVAEAVR
jgi:threonine dehydrogenase-like Zn-dependent dehydrogenase